MQKIRIEEFLALAKHTIVLDVRSPGEYIHAHIPGAYNLPLFTNEERKTVGTSYKQQSREQAIKLGLDFFGLKMRPMVEEVEQLLLNLPDKQSKTVLVHCWRGGMRSAGVAWLLDLYGFKVYTLIGGYKAFRNWAIAQFTKPYSFRVLGGYTGSGKTDALLHLAAQGHAVIDLEGLARHKGSAFGALGQGKQPTQEMFENLLGQALSEAQRSTENETCIWVEDESQRIGSVNLPKNLWQTIHAAPLYFLDIPFEQRLDYLLTGYGKFETHELIDCVERIQKRLGTLNAKNARNYLLDGNIRECFSILLHYYDKYYKADLAGRKECNIQVTNIPCSSVDAALNCEKITTQ
jgi:tRNA 2-selenouridine synthase